MNIIYDETYNGYSILTDQERGLGCRDDILNKLYQLLSYVTNKHNKVLFIRFDLRFPQDIHIL
jgi:hypothetical protein